MQNLENLADASSKLAAIFGSTPQRDRMNVLIAYECSGAVRDAFNAVGADAWSCDLQDVHGTRAGNHLKGDAFRAIGGWLRDMGGYDMRTGGRPMFRKWDVVVAHPPCTYLSVSGLHWNKTRPDRAAKTEDAVAHVAELMARLDVIGARWCIENPVGCLSTMLCKPDQIIQPYMFGDDASKKTCLWLRGLPKLVVPAKKDWHPGRWVWHKGKFVQRWSNQTDSGQNRLGPSDTRAQERATTYPGIARAMAEQWSRIGC